MTFTQKNKTVNMVFPCAIKPPHLDAKDRADKRVIKIGMEKKHMHPVQKSNSK